MTNPTIPGVLPREVHPEIIPIYDSDTSDEVRKLIIIIYLKFYYLL